MSKFGKGASFFRVRQGLQSLNPAVHIYTVNYKKRDILFLTITLANLNRLL